MLTAWGCASAFGPLLIAHMREVDGSYRSALHVIAAVMAVSTLVPIMVSPPKAHEAKRDDLGHTGTVMTAK
jgi:OFA family oxalate/formate antiporter-like MFS transporter